MNYSFNSNDSRVRKAILARTLKSYGKTLPLMSGSILFLGGAGLTIFGYRHIGLPIAGLGLLTGAVGTWLKHDVYRLPATTPANSTRLELILEPSLAARLTWPASPNSLWLNALSDWQASFMLVRIGLPGELITSALSSEPTDSDLILNEAVRLASLHNSSSLHAGHIIAAILTTQPNLSSVLSHLKLSSETIIAVLAWLERILALERIEAPFYGGIGRDWAAGFTPTLDHFASNLSLEVQHGGHNFGSLAHGSTVEQMIASLSAHTAGVALLGEAGAGKTSITYALTQRLIEGDGGELAFKQVYSLSASLLVSAAQRPGELEHLFLTILSEAIASGNIILVLDEAQLFFGSGIGALDLGQILLPLVQGRRLPLIITLDPTSWQRLTATYPSLAAAMTPITIAAPSPQATLDVLADTALGLELGGKTITQYAALTEAYRLSDRYVTEQAYPGRAIKILELAYTHAEGRLVTARSVQKAVESSLGVRVAQAQGPETDLLLHLEDRIHERMINQSRAVSVVAGALRRARAGVANPKRPVGSFLFLGPTGVGKTELARSLAAVYYNGEENLLRLDLSEFQQPADIERLLTADSPFLTGIRRQPFSVVLLDELEKAHPNFLNLLLQLLDEGRLTDVTGRAVSFKDAIVIATSNAGADEIRHHIEVGEELESFEQSFTDGLINSGQFKPELLNRFDEIVLFRPLNQAELAQVVGLLIKEVNKTLVSQNIIVTLTEAATAKLVAQGYDPRLGARPMRRMVQRKVEDAVAGQILRGTANAGDTIALDVSDVD
jgi:ATP-dependent Clp protease ATP-binding subunit ClpC